MWNDSARRLSAVLLLTASLCAVSGALAQGIVPGAQSGHPEAEGKLRDVRHLSDQAMARMQHGRLESALEDLRQAGELAAGMDDPALHGSIQYRTSLVLRKMGRYEEALEGSRTAARLAGEDDAWLSLLAANQSAEILNRLGRYGEALEELSGTEARLDSLEPSPPKSETLRARLLATGGVARFGKGDYFSAVASLRESAGLFETQGAEKELALTRLHLANTLTQLARFQEAELLYGRVAERAKAAGLAKERGDGLSGLGLLFQYEGRQEEAVRALEEALRAHEACGDAAGAARDRVNLAAVHLNRNDPDGARRQYEAALQTARELGRTREQGFALAGLGHTSLLAGSPARAEAEIREALDTLAACTCPAERAVAHELAGRVELARGRYDAAAVQFNTALDLAETLGRPETLWRAHAGLGDVRARQGDLRAAADAYLRSVEAIEAVRFGLEGNELRELYLHDKIDVYNSLVRALLALNEKYAALESLERRNRWVASDWLRRTPSFDSGERRASYEQGRVLSARVAAGREALRGLAGQGETAEAQAQALRAGLVSAEKEQEGYLRDLESTDPLLHRRFVGRPMHVELLARRLPEDTAVIAYFLDGKDCHAFSLTADSLHVTLLRDARDLLERTIERMRETVHGPPGEPTAQAERQAFQEASRSLHDLLVASLPAAVRSKSRWYILPDETLWSVPFNALIHGEGETAAYLAQEHRITMVNSLEEAPRGPRAESPDPARAVVRLAAFGDAQRTLPAAAEELKLLRRLDPEARIFIGEEATEQNARRFSRDAGVLVFASHAVRPPDAASAGIRLTPSGVDDGLLTAREIRAWDLAHVDLVVLSGCGTALSFDRGRTFLSLADAFLFAGARAVLATLWDISDPGTARFMERFVAHWKESGDYARALRLAQTDCILETSPPLAWVSPATRNRYVRVSALKEEPRIPLDLSHPYYWASFVLIEYGLATAESKTPLDTEP